MIDRYNKYIYIIFKYIYIYIHDVELHMLSHKSRVERLVSSFCCQFSGIRIVLVSSQLFLALPSKSVFFHIFSGKSPTFGRSTAKSAWNLCSQPFICTLLCNDEATSGSGSTATAPWRRLPWKAGGFSDENRIDLPYKKLKRGYHIYIYL